MTREEMIELVDLALSKGKVTGFSLSVKPNDDRPCGLFNEKEINEIETELGEKFGYKNRNQIAGGYDLTFSDYKKEHNHIYLNFRYKKSVNEQLTELEKQMAELKTKKERLENGEMEEIC